MTGTDISRRRLLTSVAAAAAAASVPGGATAGALIPQNGAWPTPPFQPRRPVTVGGVFGPARVDNYAWLRPADWHAVLRDPSSLDGDSLKATLAENAYCEAMMAPSRPLQVAIIGRMSALQRESSHTIEIPDGDWLYYRRDAADGDHATYLRRPARGGDETVLLDVSSAAQGKPFYSLHWEGPRNSADHSLFGWAADEAGSGIFSIRVRDIASGQMVVTDIDGAHGSFAFDHGGRYLFWVGRSDKGRPDGVWRRDLASGQDVRIYVEDDPAYFIGLRPTASGGFVVIRTFNGDQSEVRLIPSSDPTAEPILVQARTPLLTYDVDHWNDSLIILTNADGAVDFKLMTAPIAAPSRDNWRELTPHRAGRSITAVHPFRGYLVREEWENANPMLVAMTPDGEERAARFDQAAYALSVANRQDWDATALTFVYQSPKTPPRRRSLDLITGELDRDAVADTRPTFDPDRYVVERIEAVAADGQRVPITILSARDARRDGSTPLYLYAYGSYGASVEPLFDPQAIDLVDRGWNYAIAHVRGGAEKGSDWWRSVLKHGKKTTFTDFISCAEHLIDQGYGSRGRVVAHGYSAGGLLMGAIYTMRPDLWAGVIARVPFVDVLNTIDDYQSHPLGETSFPIWGDPRVPEDYAYMASYAPYEALRPAPYPALLATGGVADDRVAFWEPLKFTIKARQVTTASNPIMARIDMAAGHMGASGEVAQRQQSALFSAFAIWAADHRWGAVPPAPVSPAPVA